MEPFIKQTIFSLQQSGFEVDDSSLQRGAKYFYFTIDINNEKYKRRGLINVEQQSCLLDIPKELFPFIETKIQHVKKEFIKNHNGFLFLQDGFNRNKIYKFFTHPDNKNIYSILKVMKNKLQARSEFVSWEYNYSLQVSWDVTKQIVEVTDELQIQKEVISSKEEITSIYEKNKNQKTKAEHIQKDLVSLLKRKLKDLPIQEEFKKIKSDCKLDYDDLHSPYYRIENESYFVKMPRLLTTDSKEHKEKLIHGFIKHTELAALFLQIAKTFDPYLFLTEPELYNLAIKPELYLFQRKLLFSISRNHTSEKGDFILLVYEPESREKKLIPFYENQAETIFKNYIKTLRTKALFRSNEIKNRISNWISYYQPLEITNNDSFLEQEFSEWLKLEQENNENIVVLTKEKKLEFIDHISKKDA